MDTNKWTKYCKQKLFTRTYCCEFDEKSHQY